MAKPPYWGYESGVLGIMPEMMHTIACDNWNNCPWDKNRWYQNVDHKFSNDPRSAQEKIASKHLPAGVSKIDDGQYILRLVESLISFPNFHPFPLS
jgi:mannosyl-oligosaccharide alpha-1,2-mannosidase